ncbi:MAG: DUF1566 domain-containing protein, partial [Pedobacter sp.]
IHTDPRTGLMWPRNGNIAGRMNWYDAMIWVGKLNYGGYSDWRLPTASELAAFRSNRPNTSAYEPTTIWFNANGFNDVQADYYWSFSDLVSSTDLKVGMHYGGAIISNKNDYSYVWPVRGGQ